MSLARDYPRARPPAVCIPFHLIPHNSPSPSLPSNSITLIMKRNPFIHSRNFQHSPKRRRIDPEPANSHQASRPGFIDQRLIEGSQWPGYPNLVQQGPPSIQTSTLSGHEEDVHLDAFGNRFQFVVKVVANMSSDLELLAHQKNTRAFQSSNPGISHPSPEEEIFTGLKHQDVPPQKSRFFDCECLLGTNSG